MQVLDVSSILWTLGSFVGSRDRKKEPYSLTLGAGYPHKHHLWTPARMSLGTLSFGYQQVRVQQASWISGQLKLCS